ncbi:TIFA inhibitor [Phyllostomus discolor]|uniref:TIFA inhibitor n=1 Tax=Phyllostomus discolor TaxID=89673 RepID=A0A834DH76_9CHIR|nr:TIFA inhibitor [Phyllostomus discolor]
MERCLTVLQVSLHHPTQGPAVFATVPLRLQHHTSPLLLGRGLDTHLRLHPPRLSRQHLSLEPHWEKGGTALAFSLKALNLRGRLWIHGLMLRFPEQVPLGTINRVARLLQHPDGGLRGGRRLPGGLCLLLPSSPSPLICRPKAEETDEWEDIPGEPPAPGSERLAPGHLGFLRGPSQTRDSSPQPSMGRGPEIQLQREPTDGALC